MSKKKLLIILAVAVTVLALLGVVFVGAIAGVVFHSISSSEAADAGRAFLKSNERLRQQTGEVRDFGWLVTGSIKTQEAGGAATLNFKVIGERRTLDTSVNLIYKEGYGWRAGGASYRDDAGKTVELLDSYGTATTADDSVSGDGSPEDNEDAGTGGDDGHGGRESGGGETEPRMEKH